MHPLRTLGFALILFSVPCSAPLCHARDAMGPALAERSAEGSARTLPITTTSQDAARHFESGMVHYENHRWNFALKDWTEAIAVDPNFADAYVWICFTTADPAEEARDRAKAKSLIQKVTPGEQLLVQWMAGVHENRYVEGITAMNDMLAMFPHDKRLNFLAGYWLYKQDQYEIAKRLTQRALGEDATYATCYNQLAYLYSRLGDNDKALESSAKYVELLPNQPNPYDSHAEMLRLAGRFQDALENYRMALKIDPTFYISQKELGETYSLMGQEEQARAEYAKAIQQAPSDGVKAEYLQKLALTYVRQKKYADADQAYLEAATKAHATEQWIWEARAHRVMAMYEADQASALKNLDQADAVLAAKRGAFAKVDLDEEKAQILRVRVERAVESGDRAAAEKLVAEMEKMSEHGSSINMQRIYDGAAGTLFVAQGKYADAVAHLEEDLANPLSMKILITAYRGTGDEDEAKTLSKKLLQWKIPSIEEALAVPSSSAEAAATTTKN